MKVKLRLYDTMGKLLSQHKKQLDRRMHLQTGLDGCEAVDHTPLAKSP